MRHLKWTTHADISIRRKSTVSREEYLDLMTFRRSGMPLFTELFGPLIGLKEEWEEQGATPEELDFSAFRYRCETRQYVPVVTGRLGGLPDHTIEETETHRIWRDGLGRTMKLVKGIASLPLPLDYPVRRMDDWLRLRHLYEFSEARFLPGWEETAARARAAGAVICVSIPGAYDEPRQLMGDEGVCGAYYEQPELLNDILRTISDTAVRVLDRVSRTVPVDLLTVHEDMAGNAGPLVGPAQVRQFFVPYYRRVWEVLASRGARVFEMDSDGNICPLLDILLEAGINLILPNEVRAGMDIVALRQRYGSRLALAGGIDKFSLLGGKEAVRRELERTIPPMLAGGGCVLSLDHRIPPGTPLETYRFYIATVWEMLEGAATAD